MMENTVVDSQPQTNASSVEVTPLGRLLVALMVAGLAVGGWFGYQMLEKHYRATPREVVKTVAVRPQQPAPPPAQTAQSQAALGSSNQQPTPSAPEQRTQPEDVAQALAKEHRERAAQAVAWRAVTDATRQQVADLSATLQALDAKIAAIQRTSTAPKPARDEVAEGAKVVRKAVDAVKQTASVDVASLPLETIPAQAMNVTGFGKGVVGIGNQRLTVGQSLSQGETIVAIDMESHSIVTNRRIINITN